MLQRLLVIFEDEKVSPEALTYARELARRMDSEVTLLMLIEMHFQSRTFLDSKRETFRTLKKRIKKTMTEFAAEFFQEEIEVTLALRTGNPPEELLKFLSANPPFQAVIWGSTVELRGGHWITGVAGSLECPLLTVSKKAGDAFTAYKPGTV